MNKSIPSDSANFLSKGEALIRPPEEGGESISVTTFPFSFEFGIYVGRTTLRGLF